MKRIIIHKNLRLHEALRAALLLGFSVEHVRRTGEVEVWRQDILEGRPLRLNSRRHDAPQALVSMLRKALP